MMRNLLVGLVLGFAAWIAQASEAGVQLSHIRVNVTDQEALQRGARNFMNYCSGCHSLRYMRYNRMGMDIGLVDENGQLETALLTKNLIFTGSKVFDLINIAMPPEDARLWFGVTPPDLSLIGREKGADWLFSYLTGFYRDETRPYGVNNLVKPNVSMPNVLANLQGDQIPEFREKIMHLEDGDKKVPYIAHLERLNNGMMTEQQFNSMVKDLVTFLVYASDPAQAERRFLGWWVLGYLFVFTGILVLLKRDFWRGLKK